MLVILFNLVICIILQSYWNQLWTETNCKFFAHRVWRKWFVDKKIGDNFALWTNFALADWRNCSVIVSMSSVSVSCIHISSATPLLVQPIFSCLSKTKTIKWVLGVKFWFSWACMRGQGLRCKLINKSTVSTLRTTEVQVWMLDS